MHARKLLAATGAVLAALALTAAPAYANGISAHKAGQQYRTDLEAYAKPLQHMEQQYEAWSKHHHGPSTAVNAMFGAVVGPTARFGHELRTQPWPSRALGAVETLEADTTTVREDFASIASLNGTTPSSLDDDLNTWSNDAQAVASDLHVQMPNS